MNKILKILSILVIGFVMFSCSTPTNDPTLYVPEESGPETPVETPSDDPVEETPEEPTYSITFKPKNPDNLMTSKIAEYLNGLSEFKDLKKDKTVPLYKELYIMNDGTFSTNKNNASSKVENIKYYYNSETDEINSVVIVNKSVEVKVSH